jgi:hypothetical protein
MILVVLKMVGAVRGHTSGAEQRCLSFLSTGTLDMVEF